jgi:hypothetical protein
MIIKEEMSHNLKYLIVLSTADLLLNLMNSKISCYCLLFPTIKLLLEFNNSSEKHSKKRFVVKNLKLLYYLVNLLNVELVSNCFQTCFQSA